MADSQAKSQTRTTTAPTDLPPARKPGRPRFDGYSTDSEAMEARLAKRRKSRRRRRLLFLTALVVASGTGAAVWQGWFPTTAKTADPAAVTARVVRRDFTSSVLATGAVKPEIGAEVRVGARISGKVEKLRANIGDSVQVGQVIAELEKADLQANVGQRQAELELAKANLAAVESLSPLQIAKAKADVVRWEASLAQTEQERKRATRLLPKQAISGTDYDVAVANHEMGKAQLTAAQKAYDLAKTEYVDQLRQANAELARAESALKYAKATLSYATLTAPISGVIGSVSTQEGETVAAGLNSPTFVTIIDLKRLQVDAMVDEVDIGKVHSGQKAVFTVDAFPAREFSGKVVAIYPKAILLENVVYYDVVVEIEGNEDEVLRPDMTASVTIFLDEKKGVLAVPVKAVKRERGKNVVYVVSGGGPQPREVKVGWKDGAWIEIVAGLEEGETFLAEAPADAKTGK
ncbi:MAG: efflux RND transporter periplasmic adaptor subunit [Pirellulales bacterium]|nr:efflux RND transporter periplasmic adaptor subunit [Pirellulales bacterium]